VLRQGVPDRFKDLLEQFDQPKDGGDAETASRGSLERGRT
jgi:Anti-sigma factor NepR